MNKILIALITASMLLLTGCGVTATRVQKEVLTGTITKIQSGIIEGRAGLTGVGIGAVTGVALGNQVGKGDGRTAAKVAGGILGAIVGGGVQKSMTAKQGVHIRVLLANGREYNIIQESAQGLYVGQRVTVEIGGKYARIL